MKDSRWGRIKVRATSQSTSNGYSRETESLVLKNRSMKATSQSTPNGYSRETESIVLKKWIRNMQCCLQQCRVWPRLWVDVTNRFLVDDAYNWFLPVEEKSSFKCSENFKLRTRDYFIPPDEPYKFKDEWRYLMWKFGKLKEHISKYKRIMLQITNMDDFDKSHGFLFGLLPSVRKEVVKLELASLEDAIHIMEWLGDWKTPIPSKFPWKK